MGLRDGTILSIRRWSRLCRCLPGNFLEDVQLWIREAPRQLVMLLPRGFL